LEGSKFQDGCPITLMLLEMTPRSAPISFAGHAVFANWRAVMADMLVKHGWPSERIAPTVTAMIAGLEGALMLARVECNAKPVRDTVQALCWMLDGGLPSKC
jgi:TetR/AcrR family transcriptional repressor of lmrAB and yxaGH operons